MAPRQKPSDDGRGRGVSGLSLGVFAGLVMVSLLVGPMAVYKQTSGKDPATTAGRVSTTESGVYSPVGAYRSGGGAGDELFERRLAVLEAAVDELSREVEGIGSGGGPTPTEADKPVKAAAVAPASSSFRSGPSGSSADVAVVPLSGGATGPAPADAAGSTPGGAFIDSGECQPADIKHIGVAPGVPPPWHCTYHDANIDNEPLPLPNAHRLQKFSHIDTHDGSEDKDFFADPFWAKYPAGVAALKRYIDLHNTAVANPEHDGSKFVTITPAAQSGNRLIAVFSAFMFGLLTDRALVAFYANGFYASLKDQFDNPGFDWEAKGAPSAGVSLDAVSENVPTPNVENFACVDYNAAFTQKVVSIQSGQYFWGLMKYNPNFQEKAKGLFGDDVFGVVSRFLFRPNANMFRMVQKYYNEHFRGNYVVGVQMRAHSIDLPGIKVEQRALYWHAANQSAKRATKGKKIVYFLATEHSDNQKMADDEFPALNPHGATMVYRPWTRANNPAGVVDAVVDIMLLGLADDTITTAWSTFGYVAAGWGRVGRPLIVTETRAPDLDYGEHRTVCPQGAPAFFKEALRIPGEGTWMKIPHYSMGFNMYKRVRHKDPCFHYFGKWTSWRAKCITPAVVEEETQRERWC